MKPEDTGLTFEDIKEKVDKYMIETYERMDFLAESAKDQYIYNEKQFSGWVYTEKIHGQSHFTKKFR